MKSTTFLPLALATLLFEHAIAAPTTLDILKPRFQDHLQSRAEAAALAPITVGIYLCTDVNWKGDCALLKNGPGLCINLNKTFSGKVSSAGPNKEISGCTLFEQENCKGTTLSGLKYPGESNLAVSPQGGKFNDFFKSYICY